MYNKARFDRSYLTMLIFHKELTNVEDRVRHFGREIQSLTEENTELRARQVSLRKELEVALEEKERQKRDAKNMKQVNRALERDSKEVYHCLNRLLKPH